MHWTKIFKVEIDGRPVTGLKSEDGDFRVSTVQKSDSEPKVFGDDASIGILDPMPAGRPIDIDAATIDDLRRDLVDDGEFSEDQVREIVALLGC
jgi:hypothetical protein